MRRSGLEQWKKTLKLIHPWVANSTRVDSEGGGELLSRERLRKVTRRGRQRIRHSRQRLRTPAKTRRTPVSAAGCNKPAGQTTEQAVRMVRNHEGGTGLAPWQTQAEAPFVKGPQPQDQSCRSGRRKLMSKERIFGNPKRGAWIKPSKEIWKASLSTRANVERI